LSVPFRLYLISDRRLMGPDPAASVAELARAGLEAFQWREKELSPAENLEQLRAIASAVPGSLGSPGASGTTRVLGAPGGFRLFVNDRVDLALIAGCHVHLTEESVPTELARSLVPPGTLIGRSVHAAAGAREAERGGADFVTFGPVYDTPSKRGYGLPQGLDALREACAAVRIPVFALGGVTAERTPECLAAGAWGAAVIREIWEAPVRVEALRRLQRALTS
jgi:thiamine-phosphate pyrophosphorylase